MQLLKGLYLFEGSGISSNCYLIEGEKTILVDTGTSADAPLLMEQIQDDNFNISDINIIVNTHCHFDHIGGNSSVLKEGKIKLAAHGTDSPHIEEADALYTGTKNFPYYSVSPEKVDMKLKEGDALDNFRVLHTPGHTQGSMSLYNEESKILISGDLVFSDGNIGRVDLPGGNMTEMQNSLKKISALDVEVLLPGHGSVSLTDGGRIIKEAHNMIFSYF